MKPEADVAGMTAYLDSLRWNSDGLVAVIAQVGGCKPLRAAEAPVRARAGRSGRPTAPHAARAAQNALQAGRRLRRMHVRDARAHALAPRFPVPQHVDTGEVLMQAYADRNAICETLQTG